MESYKLVESTDDRDIYQFNPYTRYWLIVSIVLMFSYEFTETRIPGLVGAGLIFAYIVFCFLPSRENMKIIKDAMKSGMVELSGSIWSPGNPQRVSIPKSIKPD